MKCNVDNNKHDYFVRTNSNTYPDTEYSQSHTDTRQYKIAYSYDTLVMVHGVILNHTTCHTLHNVNQ